MRLWGSIVTAALLSLTVVPAAAQQFSNAYNFLNAVRERDGDKATSLVSERGSIVINSRDPGTGDTALHILVRERDLTWLGFMLSKGAKPDLQNKQGLTPLAIAAQIGWVEGAERLFTARAKVDLPNRFGETPLILAVHNRDLTMVKLLLARGADPKRPDTVSGGSAIDHARKDGRSSPILKALEATGGTAMPAAGPPS